MPRFDTLGGAQAKADCEYLQANVLSALWGDSPPDGLLPRLAYLLGAPASPVLVELLAASGVGVSGAALLSSSSSGSVGGGEPPQALGDSAQEATLRKIVGKARGLLPSSTLKSS